MKVNWYKKAQDKQLDFFEEQSPVDEKQEVEKKEETGGGESPSVFIYRAYKEYGAYYIVLATTKIPRRYYEYRVNVPSKWLDHPSVNWDHPFRKIEKVNPNGLWNYVEEMALSTTEVTKDGEAIRDIKSRK